MSLIDTYRNNIKRKKDEEMRLNNEKTKYLSDKANKNSRIISAKQAIGRTKSQSTIKSKIREIDRYEKIDKVLRMIELTTNISFSINGKTITITPE